MQFNEEERLSPEEFLKQVNKESRGKLKIFLGMCAGVGKTYEMLKTAHEDFKNNIDIIIGYVETHNRKETKELVSGLEIIPRKIFKENNISYEEMDLEKILNRKPKIVLVDELAHSNAPNSRHNKRYQDVLEIIDAGIDVYTTLNVQHLESRIDTVGKITGIVVMETVPDSILDSADEVEIIDISPEELLKRLAEGKIYQEERAKRASENFFKKGNLTALREMALRLTAERVDHELREYLQSNKIKTVWKSSQRLMVAVGPSPHSAQLIRWARRLSYSMNSQWIALYVENSKKLSDADQIRLNSNLKLARKLGAEIITTSGDDLVTALTYNAIKENVSQIIVGKPRSTFLSFGYSKLIRRLINESGDIDIYVMGGTKKELAQKLSSDQIFEFEINKYLTSLAIISIVIHICYFLNDYINYQTVSLIFIFTISLISLFFSMGQVLLVASVSALAWDYLFIQPKFTFYVNKLEDILMLLMYFFIAVITGSLNSKIRSQQKMVKNREKRALALYNLTKDLSSATSLKEVINNAVKNIKKTFDVDMVLLYSDDNEKLNKNLSDNKNMFSIDEKEYNVASWVFQKHQKAGKYTTTLPSSDAQYYPMYTPRMNVGVIGIKLKEDEKISQDKERLLETFIYQIASSIEREILNQKNQKNILFEESEKLYKNIFNSLSHELKTPIATILGATSNLRSENEIKDPTFVKNMAEEINLAGERLNRLVSNLLDMSRLESNKMLLNLDWHDISDLINSVINNLKSELINHTIKVEIEDKLPLLKIDFSLFEQAISNIIINATIYTPPQSIITIQAKSSNDNVFLIISDNGKGIDEKHISTLFDKFYRIPGTKTGGTGLGLSIAKGFIEAHNYSIKVENISSGGLRFTIKIPITSENSLKI
ncbi:MAG: sensor histidine kinase KdpD [Cyanobacteriota bacterium]